MAPSVPVATKAQRARSSDEKQEVRGHLLEVTRKLLSTGEFQSQTMRQIAAAAGYTTGVVYYYFANKTALIHAVRDIELAGLEDECRARLALFKEPEERLRKHIEFLRDFTERMMTNYGTSFLSGAIERKSEKGDLEPYGRQHDPSPASGRMHRLADEVVRDFFNSLPRYPTSVEVAADSLWGAINSTFTMAGASEHRRWSSPTSVGNQVLDALIMMWRIRSQIDA